MKLEHKMQRSIEKILLLNCFPLSNLKLIIIDNHFVLYNKNSTLKHAHGFAIQNNQFIFYTFRYKNVKDYFSTTFDSDKCTVEDLEYFTFLVEKLI